MSERGLYMKCTDFKELEESIRSRLMVEMFHNMHFMPDKIYFTKYVDNASKHYIEIIKFGRN